MSDVRSSPSAFVSWSGSESDRAEVRWLERGLRRYRLPASLRREHRLPLQVGRIEVDRDASAPALGDEATRTLRACDFLIAVCSPDGRGSGRMASAIEFFRSMRGDDHVVALLIRGEPRDAFPDALLRAKRVVRDEDGTERDVVEPVEPLAADIRDRHSERSSELRRLARLRLVACLFGARFDELRRRDRERRARFLRIAAAAIGAATLIFAALAVWAVRAEEEARTRTALAADSTREARAARGKEAEARRIAVAAKQAADAAAALERDARLAHERARAAAEEARAAAESARIAAERQEKEAKRAAAEAHDAKLLSDRRALQASQAKTAEDAARRVAEERAGAARAARVELSTELGRQALVSDEVDRAVAYLGDAYAAGDPSPVLRSLLGEALRRAPPYADGRRAVPAETEAMTDGDCVVPGGVAWLQDGAHLLVVQADGRARVLDARTGAVVRVLTTPVQDASEVQRALPLPRRDRLLLLHSDGLLRVVALGSGTEVRSVPGVMRHARWMLADDTGETVVLAGENGLAALAWAGSEAPVRLHEEGGAFLHVAVRPGGGSVACCQDGHSGLWDTATGEKIRSFQIQEGEAYRVGVVAVRRPPRRLDAYGHGNPGHHLQEAFAANHVRTQRIACRVLRLRG